MLDANPTRLLERRGQRGRRVDRALVVSFEAHAAKDPERAAVVDPARTWTYRALSSSSSKLARWLHARGVRPGDTVAVHAGRGGMTVCALLGVIKAGAAFMILDAEHPSQRLAEQVRLARPVAWISALSMDAPHAALDAARANVPHTIDLSRAERELAEVSDEPLGVETAADEPMYIAFTSGTTGGPKGIVGAEAPLAHFVEWQRDRFALGPDDRFTALSGLGHDPFLRDVFTPLTTGASVYFPSAELRLEPDRLAAWLAEHRITVMHLTPSQGEVLALAAGASLPDLRWAFFAGERLRGELVTSLRAIAPRARFVNFYGATETPQAMGYFVVERESPGPLPIGRGIDGVDLLVLRDDGQLGAVGEEGEICVRTPYLALGYLDGTPGGFGVDPLGDDPTARIYRTGDRGKYLSDGNIAILGRKDDQVKIRGFRVELADVEATACSLSGVRQAAVVPRDDGTALVAYIVGDVEQEAFLAALRERLPDYMVPAIVVKLDALPLTANGKVDRAALPAPARGAEPRTPAEPSENQTEATIGEIWKAVLDVETVGRHDNFFDLGGHSLNATQVATRLRAALGIEVPVRTIFDAPTVAELAVAIELARTAADTSSAESGRGGKKKKKGGKGQPGQPRASREKPRPPLARTDAAGGSVLSFWQDSILAWERRRSPSSTWTQTIQIRLRGSLDVDALREAIASVLERQEALRQVIRAEPGAPAHLCAARDVPLTIVDASGKGEEELERITKEQAAIAFAIDGSPLVRFTLVALAPEDHVLFFAWHQLVHDATANEVISAELLETYAAKREGRVARLAPLPVRAVDHAVWERDWFTGAGRGQVEAARRRLTGAKPLELPIDRARNGVPSSEYVGESFALEPEASERFIQLCQSGQATFYMGVAAVVAACLGRWCATNDVVFVSPVGLRMTTEELTKVAGRFGNWMLVRVPVGGDPTLGDLVRRARDASRRAYADASVPASLVLDETDVFGHPLSRVVINVPESDGSSSAAPVEAGGLVSLATEVAKRESCRTELTVVVSRIDKRVSGHVMGASSLFDAPTIGRLAALLTKVLSAPDSETRLSQLL